MWCCEGELQIVTARCGCERGAGGPVCWCTTLVSWRATKKMGSSSSSSSATTLCPSYCTLPIVCLQCLYFSAKLDQQVRREASSGQLCSRPIATGLTAPLAHLRHNLGKIQPVINILVRSCPNLVMVGRGGKQDRTFDCRCAKSDGLSIYGTPLMGKLLIASIDFMSGKGCNKNW